MAVDNPSYFSLQSAINNSSNSAPCAKTSTNFPSRTFSGFFRRSKNHGSKSSNCNSKSTSTLAASDSSAQLRNGDASESARRELSPSLTTFTSRNSWEPRTQQESHQHQHQHRSIIGTGRSFRSLFRSSSSSADCEKAKQFLKGDPRPSDVAPPSPYLPHRSHSQSVSDRRRSSRRNVPRSTLGLMNGDMIFCDLLNGNEARHSNRYPDPDNDYYQYENNNDIFSKPAEQPGYYNISTLPSSVKNRKKGSRRRTRRHSIGVFVDAEMTEESTAPLAGTSELIVGMNDLSQATRHASSSGFTSTNTDNAAKDDVVIVSSKDNESSTLWVNYLTACFEQISRQQGRPPFRVSQLSFEDPLTPSTESKLRNARLQIAVVCPVFLDRVTEHPEQATAISRQLNSTRLLAMMLGVQDVHLNEIHRASLVSYQQWKKFFVKDQDETFVGQLLGAAVTILGNSANASGGVASALKVDKDGFSVHPKKVKLGQNRIIALLNDPLKPDDEVSVIVDRCGEGIEVTGVKRRNPYALQFSIPERCLEVSMIVGVKISKNETLLGTRQVKCESRLRELDQILRAHDNPLEFMCQTFGFHSADRDQLDGWMVHAFQKNVPPHFNLLSRPIADFHNTRNTMSPEENPTLLHFAARFGLEKLAWQLLECPGADIACDMRNVNDFIPADLAEQSGHIKLAHQLRGYMQMNEFTNMYSYLKVISEKSGGTKTPSSAQLIERSHHPSAPTSEEPRKDYCRPKPLNEAYSVPPAIVRPIFGPSTSSGNHSPFPDYSMPPPARLSPMASSASSSIDNSEQPEAYAHGMGSSVNSLTDNASLKSTNSSQLIYTGAGDLELPLQGYLQMSPAVSRRKTDRHKRHQSAGALKLARSQESISNILGENRLPNSTGSDLSGGERSSTKSRSLGRSSSASSRSHDTVATTAADDELVEIINDFKNKVHSITEIEHLVQAWKNRDDVKQSFKDKQRQLSMMREEYDRIQKHMKAELKGPSPIDRIKQFFKGKKESKDDSLSGACEGSKKSIQALNHSNHLSNNGVKESSNRRPISSLSVHSVSSSSSGRMSTASGCSRASLGDSGTHSDTDDRRHQHGNTTGKSGMSNYEIPPAPKPFQNRLSPARFILPHPLMNGELDLPRVKSSHPTTDDQAYYIEFPPSGLPVHAFQPNGMAREPSTPSTPVKSQDFPDFASLDRNHEIIEEISYDVTDLADLPLPAPPTNRCGNLVTSDYVNIQPWDVPPCDSPPNSPTCNGNVLTVQPEIHAEPRMAMDLVPEESVEDGQEEHAKEKLEMVPEVENNVEIVPEIDSNVEMFEKVVSEPEIDNELAEAVETIQNQPQVLEETNAREEKDEIAGSEPEIIEEKICSDQEIVDAIGSKLEIVEEILKELPGAENSNDSYEFKNEIKIPIVESLAKINQFGYLATGTETKTFKAVLDEKKSRQTSTSVDEIARNFGVTLKKSTGPTTLPRTEFNFINNSTDSSKD